MNRLHIIRFLGTVMGLPPGGYESSFRSLFFNPRGLWSILTFCYTLYGLGFLLYDIYDSPYRKYVDSDPKPDGKEPITIAPDSVVVFAMNLSFISLHLTNLIIRVGIWCLFPSFIQLYEQLKPPASKGSHYGTLSLPTNYYDQWSWEEIIVLITITISQLFSQAHGTIRTMPPPHLCKNIKMDEEHWMLFILRAIKWQSNAFLSESFLVELICFIMITILTVLVKRIESNMCTILQFQDPDDQILQFCRKDDEIENSIQTRQISETRLGLSEISRGPEGFGERKKTMICLENSNSGENDDVTHELISCYLTWFERWMRDYEVLIGFFTFVLFFDITSSICTSGFIALSSSLDNGLQDFISIKNIVSVFVIIIKLLCLANTAQKLENASMKFASKIDIQHWVKETKKSEGTTIKGHCGQEKRLTHFLNFVRTNQIRASALGFFSVRRSTVTIIANVIVTYLVILLQFWSPLNRTTTKVECP